MRLPPNSASQYRTVEEAGHILAMACIGGLGG